MAMEGDAEIPRERGFIFQSQAGRLEGLGWGSFKDPELLLTYLLPCPALWPIQLQECPPCLDSAFLSIGFTARQHFLRVSGLHPQIMLDLCGCKVSVSWDGLSQAHFCALIGVTPPSDEWGWWGLTPWYLTEGKPDTKLARGVELSNITCRQPHGVNAQSYPYI